MFKQLHTTFLLVTILLFILLFCFGIFSDGMFFDGILYANVARNYAHGLGSFWKLNHGNSNGFLFYEQPPLTFFIQGQFFKLFGDSIYVERFYDFLFAIIHLVLIRILWAEVTSQRNKLYWVPMILWMSIPLCSWTFRNNLEEVTMGVFDLAAIILIWKGCRKE
jgi:4-amino-4-deoxy-L-arabinose transferase-like glycosyltransferase